MCSAARRRRRRRARAQGGRRGRRARARAGRSRASGTRIRIDNSNEYRALSNAREPAAAIGHYRFEAAPLLAIACATRPLQVALRRPLDIRRVLARHAHLQLDIHLFRVCIWAPQRGPPAHALRAGLFRVHAPAVVLQSQQRPWQGPSDACVHAESPRGRRAAGCTSRRAVSKSRGESKSRGTHERGTRSTSPRCHRRLSPASKGEQEHAFPLPRLAISRHTTYLLCACTASTISTPPPISESSDFDGAVFLLPLVPTRTQRSLRCIYLRDHAILFPYSSYLLCLPEFFSQPAAKKSRVGRTYKCTLCRQEGIYVVAGQSTGIHEDISE
ncbi:hypothetical protein C8R47DRAFT_812051 [Mycena vitilis]|nr:hypothetical protein C8R47DRAFT_812051 [Mycena vitilis]